MDETSLFHVFLIFLTPAMCLVWGFINLLKKDATKANRIMGSLLLVVFVAFWFFMAYFRPYASWLTSDIYISLAMIIPLAHYIFFKFVSDPDGVHLRDFWLAIPNSLVVLPTIILCMAIGPEARMYMFQENIIGTGITVPAEILNHPLWNALHFCSYDLFIDSLCLETGLVLLWAYFKIRKYNRILDDYFADPDRKGRYTNWCVFIAMVSSMLALSLLTFNKFYAIRDNEALFLTSSILTSLGVCFTGYYGYRIKFTAEQLAKMIEKEEKPKPEDDKFQVPEGSDLPVTENVYSLCMEGLKEHIIEKQAFLDPDLSLNDLAMEIGTNRTYLAEVIHHYYGCSFTDYINLMRIEYAEKMLLEAGPDSMLDVAIKSGYTALSSFYRNFKKFTGLTPLKWLDQSL